MDAMNFSQPVLRCKRGHVIPMNGQVVEDGGRYGKLLSTSRIVCVTCALQAGGEELFPKTKRLKRGETPEGQESLLKGIPGRFIK